MNGRLEGELKLHEDCLKLLEEMPDYVKDWYNQMRASKKTASTRRSFLYKIKKYLSSICLATQYIEINELTNESVVQFMLSIETKKNKQGEIVSTSGSYQKTFWAALNNFFQFLEDEGKIEKNYMKRIGQSKKNDLARIEKNRILLTRKDFNKILSYVKSNTSKHAHEALINRNLAILMVFMCTGIRVTALTQINIEDIDFENKSLMVIDKEDADRECMLTDNAIDYINLWLKDRPTFLQGNNTNALFLSEYGNRMSPEIVRLMVRTVTQGALGKAMSPHKLRAGFCSILYKDTKDIELVRRTVGHSSSITTQRYIVMGGEDKEKVAKSINSIGV